MTVGEKAVPVIGSREPEEEITFAQSVTFNKTRVGLLLISCAWKRRQSPRTRPPEKRHRPKVLDGRASPEAIDKR